MLNKKLIIIWIFFILILCLYYFLFKEKKWIVLFKEGFSTNKTVIPKNIFQTWKTLDVPPKMKQCVDKLQYDNPDFSYYLFDDDMCIDFIKDNYDDSVICAYNKLIPTAYKADLFRYCILYKLGGIYLDIKYEGVGGFSLNQLIDKEYFVRDIDNSGGGIYNGFMVCKPNNKILHKAIYKIVENTNSGYYGLNSLSPTGPLLLKTFFSDDEINKFKLRLKIKNNNQLNIYYENKNIMSSYPDYRNEQLKTSIVPHYGILWSQRKIYKKGGIC